MAIGDDIKLDLPESSAAAVPPRVDLGTQTDPADEAAFATRAWADSADERIGTVDQRVNDTNARVGAVDQRVAAMAPRVGAVDQRVNDTNARVDTVDQRVTDTNGRLGGVDERLNQVTQRLDDGRIDGPSETRRAQIDAITRIRDELPNDSTDAQVRYVRSSLTSNIEDMRNARTDSEFVKAQDSAAGHVSQLQSRNLATEAHRVGNKTAQWIGLAAIPGLLALIPSSIIAANNQTDRNKTVAGDNNG